MAAEKSDRELNAAAFDAAGYLVDQSLVEAPYGRYPARRNGCGWIAAYNLCRALGRPVGAQAVRGQLARGLWFGGALGTGPLRLRRFLSRALGKRVRLALPRNAGPGPGILFYWAGNAFHYAVYLPAPDGVRFLNIWPGPKDPAAPSVQALLQGLARFLPAFCLIFA